MTAAARAGAVAIALFLARGAGGADLAVPRKADIGSTLCADRPFLLAPGTQGVARLQKKLRTNPLCARWLASRRGDVATWAPPPPVQYRFPDCKRLLFVSQKLNRRLEELGLLYLVNRDPALAGRAWVELDAVARFKN